jgi:hypothetical protein
MNQWTYRKMSGWMNRRRDGRVDCLGQCMDGQLDNGRLDRWLDAWMHGFMDGMENGCVNARCMNRRGKE